MGENRRSICLTYRTLFLHCSYLTLISSYHSQSLTEQVPQSTSSNRELLHSRDRSTLGFGH